MKDAGKRILVVDDDAAIRSLLLTILRRRGLRVDTAADGVEAIERLRLPYAVVILDLMMPNISGYGVLEHIATLEQRPLIIVLTAGSESRNLDPALVAGTLRKPFDIELLVDTVCACVAAALHTDSRTSLPLATFDGENPESPAGKPN